MLIWLKVVICVLIRPRTVGVEIKSYSVFNVCLSQYSFIIQSVQVSVHRLMQSPLSSAEFTILVAM